jgi:GT2 family glycosyltransferase
MQPKVTVIVCTVGRKVLENCIRSVKAQRYPNFDILLCSFKKELKSLARKAGCGFVFSSCVNVSAQRNLAIKRAKGEIIAFIDDDSMALSNWLYWLVRPFEQEGVVCVGGKILLKFLAPPPPFLRELPKEISQGYLGQTLLEFEKRTVLRKPLLWASNLAFRKSIFKKVGYFDPQLGRSVLDLMGEEEIELQQRILNAGFKIVYEPRARVAHLIEKEKLTRDYFLRRAFWQGYSELMRMRLSEEVNRLRNSCPDIFVRLNFWELLFQLIGSSKFSKDIELARRLGRLAAFTSLKVEG